MVNITSIAIEESNKQEVFQQQKAVASPELKLVVYRQHFSVGSTIALFAYCAVVCTQQNTA